MGIGYCVDFVCDMGFDCDVLFVVVYFYYNCMVEMILLFKGFFELKVEGKNDIVCMVVGIEYYCCVMLKDGVFSVE